jgi:hypothetical protein
LNRVHGVPCIRVETESISPGYPKRCAQLFDPTLDDLFSVRVDVAAPVFDPRRVSPVKLPPPPETRSGRTHQA